MTATPHLIHPLTGAPWAPIGHRKNGQAIWPILGGSEPPEQPTPEDNPGDADKDKPEQPDEVGKWKALARKHETDAKAGREARQKLAQLEEASKTDLEKAVAAARKEATDSVLSEVRRDRVLDRIEVLAAKDFADPEDARLRLGSKVDELVDGDGKPDAAAIKAALGQLLTDRPHLAAVKPDGRPRGDADLGPRDTTPKRASSLAEAVTARLAAGTTR